MSFSVLTKTRNIYFWLCFQGGCKLTPVGYGHMTHMLSGLANGRVILVLEVRTYSQILLILCLLDWKFYF